MQQATHADVVICGAGIAGIATAYYLAIRYGITNIVLVDDRPPLSLTSDKSTECYRNWWPGPDNAMVQLMNRSIDLLEELEVESNRRFHLEQRGYVYATAYPERVPSLCHAAEQAAQYGAGPVRFHRGSSFEASYDPTAHDLAGSDVVLDTTLIRTHFPYLSDQTVALVHARRCGWFSAQQLGMYLLEQARACGVRLINGRVIDIEVYNNAIESVQTNNTEIGRIITKTFVNAAGPLLREVGQMMSVDLPVFCERHLKVAFNDYLGVVPREAPMLIWDDPLALRWSEDERQFLAESDELQWLLDLLPPGIHTRPEGGPGSTTMLMLWAYDTTPVPPVSPLLIDPEFPDVVLRGMVSMIPGLQTYVNRIPKPFIDGGYYIKTRENRPLIGSLPVDGAYVVGALSGFGVMAASGAGELMASHIVNAPIPEYALAFSLSRYEDPVYQAKLMQWDSIDQL